MNSITFAANSGKNYTIKIDDFGVEIMVFLGSKEVGKILLKLEEGLSPGSCDTYLISSLSLDECKFQGVGRRCLQLHKEIFESPIYARPHDGIVRDDATHLTGDGPGFVSKMREEGLIAPTAEDFNFHTGRYD